MAKRTLKEFSGASSDAEAVPGSGGGNFARFAGIQIAAPRTDLGGLVSQGFHSQLSAALRERLISVEDAPFKGGSPYLSLEPQVMYYHRGGGLFPDKLAVVLFWFKADGTDLGRVQIATRSEASRTGDADLADSMAKELVDYFEDHGKER